MKSTTEIPYELHTHGNGAFVIFNVGDQVAVPLIALMRATLRSTDEGDEIDLEFQNLTVSIAGRALSLMLEHLLAGRVKRISCADATTCNVARIQFTETQ